MQPLSLFQCYLTTSDYYHQQVKATDPYHNIHPS